MKVITIWSILLFGASCTLIYAFGGFPSGNMRTSSDQKKNDLKIDNTSIVQYESELGSSNKDETLGNSTILFSIVNNNLD